MNALDFDFGNTDYDETLYNTLCGDEGYYVASLEQKEYDIHFSNAKMLYIYAVKDLDLSDANPKHICCFRDTVNVTAKDFCNNRTPFDKTGPCIICGGISHDLVVVMT